MLTIQARENDDQILLRSMGLQRMKYIEDENQNYTNIDSQFYSQSNVNAVPMYYFNVPKGTWSVDISCEGYQPTSSTTDPNRGRSDGLIAYSNSDSDYWNVGEADGVKISNLRNDNTYRQGHPDLEINSCHFRDGQLLERDATISFHVEAPDDGRFFLIGPAIQKTAKYNYTISYGEWTDRDMELGLITVVLDEHLEGSGSGNLARRERRSLHQHCKSLYAPEGPPENKPWDDNQIIVGERQLRKTLSVDMSGTGSDLREGKLESNPSGDARDELNYTSNISDSEDELIDEPNFVPGMRMNLEAVPLANPADKDYILRDRGITTNLVEPAYMQGVAPQDKIEEDPWKHVRDFKSAHTSKGPASVASGSTMRGTLRGRSMPPPLPPPAEKVGDSLPSGKLQWDPPGSPLTPFKDKELTKPPSDARSSVSSRLTGGLLKSRVDKELASLTTAQRQRYEITRQTLGKTAAQDYLRKCKEGDK